MKLSHFLKAAQPETLESQLKRFFQQLARPDIDKWKMSPQVLLQLKTLGKAISKAARADSVPYWKAAKKEWDVFRRIAVAPGSRFLQQFDMLRDKMLDDGSGNFFAKGEGQ